MSDKKIKLIALSVSMVLSTHMVLAEDLITDFGGLKDALKNATGSSVTVKLGSDISATARITIGTNTPTSVTILGESKKYGSTTLAFDVKYNTTLTLNNITLDSIQHGSSWGGAMYNEGTLILDNVIFNNNIAKTPKAVGGGAMALVATRKNPVSTTIKNSTFTNNSTKSSPSYENNGGAIYVYGTYGLVGNNTLNISDSHFESNNTNKTGGAIGVNNLGPSKFEIEIKDTTFTKNNSTGYGGAIDVTTGDTGKVTLNLYNATFNANKSGSDGGAIAYEKGNITSNIINSKFTNNTASTVNGSSAHGGAIYTRQDLVINANNNGLSEFTGNYVTTDGGATRNYEAINVGASGKTLTLNATTNGTILLNDYINGVNGYNVLLTGDSTGTIKLFDKADIKGGANVTVGGNVVIDTADGIIQNFSEFNSLNSSTSAKYNIDIDLSKANGGKRDYTIGDKIADGFTTHASSNGSIITLDSLNFLGNSFDDFLDKNLKIQIIQNNENTDDLQLALSDKLTPLTSTAGRIKHIVTTKTNSLTPTANYKDIFGSITTTKDVYGILGLNKTNTTNDSLNLKVTKIDTDIDAKTSDALVALTNTVLKDNDGNILDKTFNLFDEDSLGNKTPANYKLSDNLGSIYKNLNIVGATKTDTLGEITLSELDLNGKSSFVVNSGSTLNISDIKLKGNETVIKNNGGSLNFANNNIIDGKITGTTATNTGVLGINANNLDVALINNGTLNLGVGNIEKEITGSGLTNILDVVTNNAFISQNVNVDSSGILTVNANIGNLINRGEVTSNTNNLTGSISNSGILILSGSLDKTILGNGTTKIAGDSFTILDGAAVKGILDINNQTLNVLATNTTNMFNDVNVNSGALNLINNSINNLSANSFKINGNVNLLVDADLENSVMDRLPSTTVANGLITVKGINLLSDSASEKTYIPFAYDNFKDKVQTNITTVGKDVNNEYQTTAFAPIYKYDVSYNPNNGNFLFSRGGGKSSVDFNPAVLAGAVNSQVGAYSAINETFSYAFRHADYSFMTLPKKIRKFANKYALTEQRAIQYENDYSKAGGTWYQPYANFENVGLSNGPRVDIQSYGSLIGGDSRYKQLKRGWGTVITPYMGYNGTSQDYPGVSTTTNGGILGLTKTFYNGEFFTALTINAGASNGESHTMYGKENYTALMAGIGSKTGYNFEFNNGKFIIQPSILMAYTSVNTLDYTISPEY